MVWLINLKQHYYRDVSACIRETMEQEPHPKLLVAKLLASDPLHPNFQLVNPTTVNLSGSTANGW